MKIRHFTHVIFRLLIFFWSLKAKRITIDIIVVTVGFVELQTFSIKQTNPFKQSKQHGTFNYLYSTNEKYTLLLHLPNLLIIFKVLSI